MRTAVNKRKLFLKVLSGSSNIRFSDVRALIEALGFRLVRVSGSHHIFEHSNVRELVNIQESNGQAKPYQIRQFPQIVDRYQLELGEDK